RGGRHQGGGARRRGAARRPWGDRCHLARPCRGHRGARARPRRAPHRAGTRRGGTLRRAVRTASQRRRGMPTYLTPGVYVEEVPSASKPIEGGGTSVAAVVGLAPAGPLTTPVQIPNRTALLRT